jgi:hypothetical protein
VPAPRRGSEWRVWIGTEVGKYWLDPPPQRNRPTRRFPQHAGGTERLPKAFQWLAAQDR